MGGDADLLCIPKLLKQFQRIQPDVVHLQCAHAHVFGGIAARISRVPAVILSRRLDNPPTGWVSKLKYRHFYDAIIAVSHGVKKVLVDAGVPPELIEVVHSAVPTENNVDSHNVEEIRKEFNIDHSTKVITVLAHVEYRKGVDTLLEAVSLIRWEYPKIKVLVVGGGAYRHVVERKAIKKGLGAEVVFTGFRTDVADILAVTDVVVSPSYLEGCSNALLEGMAAGKPVVGTAVGGTPEIIEHYVNGLLVPPRNSRLLAEAVLEIITNPQLAAKMGEIGRKIVRERFSVDRMIDETLRVYQKVLSKHVDSVRF
jgi:glycosyltransferase involved in cell wall biosynthesis